MGDHALWTPQMKAGRYAVLLAALCVCAYAFATRTPHLGLFHDDGVYAVTARSLSEGRGYRVESLPGRPTQTKYPVLYPLVLSVVWRITPSFPGNIGALKAVNVAALLLYLLASAALFRRLCGRQSLALTLSFVVLAGLNPLTIAAVDSVLSDTLFAALVVSAMALHCRERARSSFRGVAAAAAVSGLAMLTRQAGVVVACAGLCWVCSLGRRHALVYGGVLASVIIAGAMIRGPVFIEHNLLAEYYTGYETRSLSRLLTHPREWAAVVRQNVSYIQSSAGTFLVISIIPGSGWLIASMAAIGARRTFASGGLMITLATAMYSLVVLLYPFEPTRYLLPLIPLLLICVFEGRRLIAESLGHMGRVSRVAAVLASAPVILALLGSLAWARWNAEKDPAARFWLYRTSYSWDGFSETMAWVSEHTQVSDVLATPYDPMYFLYTGRQSVRPWLHRPETYFYPQAFPRADVGDPRAVLAALDDMAVSYLVVDPMDGFAERAACEMMFESLVTLYGSRATLVFESGDRRHRVYRIERENRRV